MQFGHALDQLLREILLADPSYGLPEMMINIADGFYRIQLNVGDISKLGVVFPTRDDKESLVACISLGPPNGMGKFPTSILRHHRD